MALRDEAKKEVGKMRQMKPGKALEYFWTYYKLHLLFIAIGIFFLVLIFQAFFGKRAETVFSAMLVNISVTQEAADGFADYYSAAIGLDSETQEVLLDTSVSGFGRTGQEDVAGMQKTLVSVAAGEVDALLTTAAVADTLLKGGALADLQAVLPEESFARYRDRLVYVDAAGLRAWSEANKAGQAENTELLAFDSAGMSEPVPVGVEITGACERAFGRPAEAGPVIFCVSVTTKRQEATARFLEALDSYGGDAV